MLKSIAQFPFNINIYFVPNNHFWTASVYIGLFHAYNLPFYDSLDRLILMNSDILPSDWGFLVNYKSDYESLALVDSFSCLKKSGYTISPFPFHHKHGNIGASLSSCSDYLVDVVPTRLLSFTPACLADIVDFMLSLKVKLPHYGADYVLTSYISYISKSPWLIRTDTFIVEDTSTTGLKRNVTFDFISVLYSLRSRKSVFNLRTLFWYPLLVRHFNLDSIISRLFYAIQFYISYLYRFFA